MTLVGFLLKAAPQVLLEVVPQARFLIKFVDQVLLKVMLLTLQATAHFKPKVIKQLFVVLMAVQSITI